MTLAIGGTMKRWKTEYLSELPGMECPCGIARRGFSDCDALPGTVHLTEIHLDAKSHYHKRLAETYVVLECEAGAELELDGERIALQPLQAVFIPPGVRHRAIGRMRVLLFCTPKFDPSDEYFD